MENKKIITHLSFTSLILIIIVTYSSLTLTLFSNPTFSLFNTITTISPLNLPNLFSSFLLYSSLLLRLFSTRLCSRLLCFSSFFSPVRDKPFQNCCSA
ncbi:hypothetical protein LWI29_027343 [Acer saccharum]|uniref:Uncharacterized protein n=1 Tax=Acer saccharum TaxID=4024 RepID=A0AA39S556_ACESA|nr:hypothetical protein LWI29_027343 [Acer saccharum]